MSTRTHTARATRPLTGVTGGAGAAARAPTGALPRSAPAAVRRRVAS